MTRLIAFQIIGGSIHNPVVKFILAIPPDGKPFVGRRYFFNVVRCDGPQDDENPLLPQVGPMSESLYYRPCGDNLQLAEEMFVHCDSAAKALEWRQGDIEADGERRHWERVQK